MLFIFHLTVNYSLFYKNYINSDVGGVFLIQFDYVFGQSNSSAMRENHGPVATTLQ